MKGRTDKLRILLIAVAIALAPIIGLNMLLWFQINAQGEGDIQDAASGIVTLVENQLDEAATQLVSLSLNEGLSCDSAGIAALQHAALHTVHGIEIAMLDESGAPRCATGPAPRLLRAVSRPHDTGTARMTLTAVDLGDDNGPRLVRLELMSESGGFAILIPAADLMPPMLLGRLQADFVARLLLIDGTFLATRLSRADMVLDDDAEGFRARDLSGRYPVAVAVEVPSAALWRSYRPVFVWGNVGGAALALLIVFGAMAAVRQTEGPVRDIDQAIRRGDFIPYYQPVVDLRSGRILGCEVLVRRRRPDGGIDGPGSFIQLVEATGQIYEITRAVMIGARNELGPLYASRPDLKASFNLVAGHFENINIIEDVEEIFSGYGLSFSQVVLEVTERQPLPNLARARVIIARLQKLGVRVALDDVGTGHGGLTYLLKLGVDQMKIDKMFIDAIGTDRYSATIVDLLVTLASELSMELIAEGVETMEQVEYLRARGVDAAQGYVFAPPLTGTMFKALIEAADPKSMPRTAQEKSATALRA